VDTINGISTPYQHCINTGSTQVVRGGALEDNEAGSIRTGGGGGGGGREA